jgi:putative spermidine/putrescine transport system ATP-binding protein
MPEPSRSALPSGKSLLLDGITQRYGAAVAVEDVTLDIKGGELVALLGPSGCGKTTLLKAIAGFVRQTNGHVVIGGEVVDDLPPNRRAVGIVFQNYALFPHMTVARNIAYGLEVRGVPSAEKSARVAEMLALVKIETFADRYPRQLSGGQQQRVAIARALAVQPSILLLDEPFSALDKNLRLDMQIEVRRIQRTAGTTTILVTHDQEEALSMADRVAVLSKGKLEQFAPPTEIYDAPGSLFVNTFVGAANVLTGVVTQLEGDIAWIGLPSGETLRAQNPRGGISEGTRVSMCLRPEHLEIATTGPDGIAGIVEMGLPLGASIVHEVRIADGTAIKIATPRSPGIMPFAAGTAVRVLSAVPATIFPRT